MILSVALGKTPFQFPESAACLASVACVFPIPGILNIAVFKPWQDICTGFWTLVVVCRSATRRISRPCCRKAHDLRPGPWQPAEWHIIDGWQTYDQITPWWSLIVQFLANCWQTPARVPASP